MGLKYLFLKSQHAMIVFSNLICPDHESENRFELSLTAIRPDPSEDAKCRRKLQKSDKTRFSPLTLKPMEVIQFCLRLAPINWPWTFQK